MIMHSLSTGCDQLCCGNVWKSYRIEMPPITRWRHRVARIQRLARLL